MQPNFSGQTPQGNETADALRSNVGGQSHVGNQTQSGQAFPGQPFQSLPQVMQIPVTAAVPVPSLRLVIQYSICVLLVIYYTFVSLLFLTSCSHFCFSQSLIL